MPKRSPRDPRANDDPSHFGRRSQKGQDRKAPPPDPREATIDPTKIDFGEHTVTGRMKVFPDVEIENALDYARAWMSASEESDLFRWMHEGGFLGTQSPLSEDEEIPESQARRAAEDLRRQHGGERLLAEILDVLDEQFDLASVLMIARANLHRGDRDHMKDYITPPRKLGEDH